MRPVPTMYSSKQTPQVRPPSLLYTSPESMKLIEKHDKDSAANFDKETSRQTRACSNAKQSVSGKRKAPLTTLKEKEPPKKKKVNLKERVQKPKSQTQLDLEDGDFSPTPLAGELGKKDRALPILDGRIGFICAKCSLNIWIQMILYRRKAIGSFAPYVKLPCTQHALHQGVSVNINLFVDT